MERELGDDLKVQWGGSLDWTADPGRARGIRERVAQSQRWGYPARLIDEEEFQKLEKNVVPGPVSAAYFSEEEGSIDPVRTTEVLLEHAKAEGARVEYPCEVREIDLRWGRLRGVKTTQGDFELDVLVVAAGVDTPKLAAMAGLNPNRKIFEARKRETAALGAGEKLVLGHPLAATIGDSARCMQNLEKVLFTGPKTSDTVTFICD